MNALSAIGLLSLDPDCLVLDRNNIRQTPNPAYRQIKDSIRSDHGEALLFPVARLDDSAPWVVVGGFGSRLRAVQELKQEWSSEDANPYQNVRCLPVSQTGDLPQLMAGLRENSARGDTSYAELSLAIIKARQLWDASHQNDSTDILFLAFLRESGISFGASTYSLMKTTVIDLCPLLPEWLLQGRASAEEIKAYTHFRTQVIKAISSPPEWITLSVELNKKQARQFFDQHFQAIAPSADSANLNWKKNLQSPMVRRLAGALSISTTEFSRLLSGSDQPDASIPKSTPVFTAFIDELNSPTPQWELLAKNLDVPTTFEGCLRALAQLSPREAIRLNDDLKSVFSDGGSHASTH